MTNKALNQTAVEYLNLVSQMRDLRKQLDASKKVLMTFDGIHTNKFNIFVAVTKTERVVGKDVLISKLGEERVRSLDLLKAGESRSLKVVAR